jgi:multisubunit Na+/H+ antiporter MnhB subunit
MSERGDSNERPACDCVSSGEQYAGAQARATLIAFIAMSACFGIILSASHGAYSPNIGMVSLVMAPAAAVGCTLGLLIFSYVPRRAYRSVSLSLLAAAMSIAVVTASLAVWKKAAL